MGKKEMKKRTADNTESADGNKTNPLKKFAKR
jgi:hypothetical protein